MPAIRRYTSLPSAIELVKVAGIVIVDAPPPVPVLVASFGKICVVGEFEDGPYNTPTDLLSSTDQASIFGGFGYQYGTTKYQYPCAQQSGGTEPWNGNGWVQTARLRFAAACFVRVDTSIGSVNLTPLAYVQGTLKAPFNVSPGQTFIWNRDGVTKTATFAGTAASVTASAGTYTSFVGGEQLAFSIDGVSYTVTFQAGDSTLTAIIARINGTVGQTVASNASSQLKLSSLTYGTGSSVAVTASSTATTLGLSTTPSNGTGDAVNLAVMTLAEFTTKVQATDATTSVTQGASLANTGYPRIVSKTAGTGTVQIGAGTANAALGFTQGSAATTAALPSDTVIPAGTRVSNAGASRVVTTQSTVAAKGSVALVTLKVRPAVDDGSYAGVSGSTLVTLEDKPGDLEWGVAQPSALSAALTAAQLDSAYATAIASTLGPGNDTTKKINGIVAARHSTAIRGALESNAITASANGHFDRRAFLSQGRDKSAATLIADVANYRDETCSYVAGAAQKFLQEMVDGGYASATGSVNGVAYTLPAGTILAHSDVMLAARWSVLAPGSNPGQIPEDPDQRWDTTTFPGLEPIAQSWDVTTYAAFKTAGMCALEFDKDVGLGFEQGITTVDPAVDPKRTTISRRTLAGFIGDQCSGVAKPHVKRQGTNKRRDDLLMMFESFLESLKPETVTDFSVSWTTDGQPRNVVRFDFAVQQTQSDDVILFNLAVGPNAITVSK